MASYFYDPVTLPKHYLQSGDKYLAISIHERLPFNLACVSKYLWRFKDKNGVEDLEKAKWFYKRERDRWNRMNVVKRFFHWLWLAHVLASMPEEGVAWRSREVLEMFASCKEDAAALKLIEDSKEILPC